MTAIFQFVVRRLRWMARVPGAAHLFDAFLLTETCLFHRERLAAMESLEAQALRAPGVRMKVHRFGGVGFALDGRELGHLHGNGLLDAFVGNERRRELVAARRVMPHHVKPESGWVSYQLQTKADVAFALELLFARAPAGSERAAT